MTSIGSSQIKNAGYPVGGSLHFAQKFADKYLALGGKINYGCRVKSINTKVDKATGITLNKSESIGGVDLVISAADSYDTFYNLLGGNYTNKKFEKLYKEHPIWPSMVLVSLGINRTFENEPNSIEFYLTENLIIDQKIHIKTMPVTIYNFDPTLAPEGKTVLRAMLHTDHFNYWQDLRKNNHDRYLEEKNRIAGELIRILDRRFPNLKGMVEAIDVATPATFYRYTNNWQGSPMGWQWLPGLIPETISKTLPGLKDFLSNRAVGSSGRRHPERFSFRTRCDTVDL